MTISKITAQTQKAKSLQALSYASIKSGCNFQTPTQVTVFNSLDLDKFRLIRGFIRDRHESGNWFARPCPKTPCHGFVPSRSLDELTAGSFWDECKQADPDFEVILMPKIQADSSAIITENGITVGPGHDGATGNSGVQIPTPGDSMGLIFDYPQKVKEQSAITDSPFIEMVFKGDSAHLVQLRDGPSLPATINSIPRRTKVRHIIKAEQYGENLLLAASDIKAVAETPDGEETVLIASSLASHFAIHGVINGLAVVCDGRKITAGDVLEKEESNAGLNNLKPRQELAEMIRHYDSKPATLSADSAKVLMGTLHASPAAWGEESHLLKLRAFSLVQTIRHITGACIGEMRHKESACEKEGLDLPRIAGDSSYTRQSFHRVARFYSLDHCHAQLEKCARGFSDYQWNSNYGGKKWGTAAKLCISLKKRSDRFLGKTSANQCQVKDWSSVMEKWNETISAVHNGGVTLLSKYVDQKTLDGVATNPASGFTNSKTCKIAKGI